MAEAQVLVQQLLTSQNLDGGWSYQKGTSWAEPTALAVLALQSVENPAMDRSGERQSRERGATWLLSCQKPSGGWAPNSAVKECTSVTSLATMALLSFAPKTLRQALDWTAGQVYRDDLSFSLLLAKVLNLPPAHAPGSVPWYPGTAGWVMPTALTALALLRAAGEKNRPELRAIAATSCAYLLSRRCVDNGWNHGGSKTRSEDATSYPETTGLALLALRAASVTPPAESIALAKQFARRPESVEGLSWIQMALQASGQSVPDPETVPSIRTTRDLAIRLIALSAIRNRNVFLSA